MVLEFGKHKGRTTEWVWANDRGYAEWVIRTESSTYIAFAEARVAFAKLKIDEVIRSKRHRGYDEWNYNGPFDKENPFFDFKDFERMRAKMGQQQRHPPPPRRPQQKIAWWDELGVEVSAPLPAIKTAYRKLVSKYHPDRNKSPDAVEKTQRINAAYDAALKGR